MNRNSGFTTIWFFNWEVFPQLYRIGTQKYRIGTMFGTATGRCRKIHFNVVFFGIDQLRHKLCRNGATVGVWARGGVKNPIWVMAATAIPVFVRSVGGAVGCTIHRHVRSGCVVVAVVGDDSLHDDVGVVLVVADVVIQSAALAAHAVRAWRVGFLLVVLCCVLAPAVGGTAWRRSHRRRLGWRHLARGGA